MHDILRLSAAELLTLFQTLEAPGLEEMHGEYAALLLRQPNLAAALSGHMTCYNPLYPGMWLAKAFRPVGAVSRRHRPGAGGIQGRERVAADVERRHAPGSGVHFVRDGALTQR
jgi:hypothetical protein